MIRRAAALVLLTVIGGANPAFACAPAPHAGDRVYVVEESALILWEPATKTQHFIRRATFQGKADDFGFLVPTPTAPTLSAVDDSIFDKLNATTARKTEHVTRKRIDWTPLVLVPFMLRHKGEGVIATAPPVEVLATQKVAGYDAAVLDATDAAALREWLEKNGYATTPDLEEWLDAYIQQRWKITAFKIDKDQPEGTASTSAVKMSFTTDRPFFPYREPASQRDASMPRALRIWFVGPERVAGTIGSNGHWPGVLMWSGPYENGTRLSYYVDTSSIRPGTDELFFARDADQSTHIPPPYIDETVKTTHVPADLVALPILILGFVFWRRRRRVT